MSIDNVLESNPFKKSVYAKIGNPVAKDIYTSVGYALTQWELSEASLGSLFTAFVKPTGGNHLAYRAFGAVLVSGSRREMILEAAEVYFTFFSNEALLKRIDKLMDIYSDASRRRDEIAHGVVMSEPLMPDRPPVYFLIPSFYASRKLDVLPPFRSKYRFSSKELDHYAKCFGELGARAGKLMQDVHTFYQSLPETLRAQFP